jgi:hypothetical protein
MAKSYKQSSSLLTKCFRFNKTISTSSVLNNNSDITTITSSSNTCPLSSVIEAIQTIDQLVQSAEGNCNNQQDYSHCIQKTMNIEQIEEMLIKWTHIAHFLIDTYQQVLTEKNLI